MSWASDMAHAAANVLASNAEYLANGVYDQMIASIFPVNEETASYTQESFYSWRIFGSPYMLLDDPPLGAVSNSGFLGEWYINQLRQSQILTLKLGIPKYTGNQKGVTIVDHVNGAAQSVAQGKDFGQTIVDSMLAAISMGAVGLDEAKRQYIFYNQYEIYLQYVRLMIVSMAAYLGVLNYPVPTLIADDRELDYSYKTVSTIDWSTYTTNGAEPTTMRDMFGNGLEWFDDVFSNAVSNAVNVGTDSVGTYDRTSNSDFSDTYYDVAGGPPAIVQFIIQPAYAVDNFGNTTAKSIAQSMADESYNIGKEVAWLTNVGGNSSITGAASGIAGSGAAALQSILDQGRTDPAISILGSGMIGMIRGLTGERMIFPEIYNDSSFEKSLNYNIKLVSPQGDPYSYFMNIGLPLCYLIPAVAPKTSSINAYKMPFMCQAYVTGQTAIPMAIIQSMTITRGASGAMNKDGLPLEVDVTLSIKDLYSNLAVSALSDPAQFLSNESLIEYIASFTQIETWNKSITNQYLAGDIADAVKDESFDVEKIWDRIKYNLGEYAGNQLKLYGIAPASR